MNKRFEAFSGSVVELNRCLQKLKDLEMRKFGLRSWHGMCLYYLGQHPEGLTVSRLTALCREDKAAVSRTLAELSKRGLTVSDQPENKRAYRTAHRLTEAGQALVSQIDQRIALALAGGGSGLTDAQRETFYKSLEIITANLSGYISRQESKEEP